MHRRLHTYWRILVPVAFIVGMLVIATPSALAVSYSHGFNLVGPKARYLALGDSLAFGLQPDADFSHGYTDVFMSNLSQHGVKYLANLGCPGETSSTFINGWCPYSFLRKYPYAGSQLAAAIAYLKSYRGQVSPVTLDIGAGDLQKDIDTSTCSISSSFTAHLEAIDANVHSILRQLRAAMTINGHMTGDILLMNYYDPDQNICPNTVPYIRLLNRHLAIDVQGYGSIVDVFAAFGGASVPNGNICNYTWMCSIFKDIHSTSQGYSVIAGAFENDTGY